MKIKYKINDILVHRSIGLSPNEEAFYQSWSILPEKFHLTFDKTYNVYGIEYTNEGWINFMIKDDTGVTYPQFYPSEFFEIIDNRLSKFFVCTKERLFPIRNISIPSFISYKELVSRGFIYEDFLDGKSKANEIFTNYKEKIDKEYIDYNYPFANHLVDDWFLCYNCDESWEINDGFEMLKCPRCKRLQNIKKVPDFHDKNK